MKKTDRMLFRMISKSKSQYIAVLSIIIMGVVIYTAMGMSASNLEKTLNLYYEKHHFSDIFAEGNNFPEGKVADAEALPQIESAEGKLIIDAPFISEDSDERITVRVNSTKGDEDEQNLLYILEGRQIKRPNGEIILGKQFAEARNITIGEKIKFQAKSRLYEMSVCGIADSPEYIYIMENSQTMFPDYSKFGVVYLDEVFMQQIFASEGSYNKINFTYKTELSKTEEQDLLKDLEEILAPYGLIRLIEKKDHASNNLITTEVDQLKLMSSSLPILFLGIAAIILAMMLGRMVKKDRIKIGVLKALGYNEVTILLHYVKYSLSAGILGGVLAAIIGTLTANVMTMYYLMYFNIPMVSTEIKLGYSLLSVLLSAIFCAISGIFGARGVLKISPAEAMRAEAPKEGKRILLEKIDFFWKSLSFSDKMVWRNLFRNKKRTTFVTFGVLITFAMMLFVTTMPAVVDDMIVKHFSEFQKMDYNVSLKKPVNKSAILDLGHMVEVDNAEGKLEYPFELKNGNKKQVVSIIGLDKNTSYFNFKDVNRKSLSLPTDGLVLSDNLAGMLNVGVGDKVQIKSFIPNREDIYIKVEAIAAQSLGINAYMNIEVMGQKLMDKNVINGFYFNSEDPDVTKELLKASNVESILSMKDIKGMYEKYMVLVMAMIGFMLIFAGILGFAITYNATIISFSEREMEFSSLRVLGFTKNEIFQLILKENAIIIIVGLLLGMPVGTAMLKYSNSAFSTEIFSINMIPTMGAVTSAVAVTVGFLILAQLATYRKINKLDFIQSLKNRE